MASATCISSRWRNGSRRTAWSSRGCRGCSSTAHGWQRIPWRGESSRRSSPSVDAQLESLAPDLWVARRPLPLAVGDVGARMTVLRLGDGTLMLHSPVPLDPLLSEALRELGAVKWLLGPSKVHHLFLGDYVKAFPDAALCGAPGLAEKRRDLAFQHVLGAVPPP